MRKLLLLLVAIPLFAAPAAAAARAPEAFTAGGEVCLTQLPVPLGAAWTPTGALEVFLSGEVLTGEIDDSDDWEDLEDAEVMIIIDEETASFDFVTGTFSGSVTGRLFLTIGDDDGDDGDNTLSGTLSGTVSGSFSNPADLLGSIEESSAQVSWKLTGAAGVQARGTATAEFSVAPELEELECESVDGAPAFGGTVTLSGNFHEGHGTGRS